MDKHITSKDICMFNILTTLYRVMRDIKANYKYTPHMDVNECVHFSCGTYLY